MTNIRHHNTEELTKFFFLIVTWRTLGHWRRVRHPNQFSRSQFCSWADNVSKVVTGTGRPDDPGHVFFYEGVPNLHHPIDAGGAVDPSFVPIWPKKATKATTHAPRVLHSGREPSCCVLAIFAEEIRWHCMWSTRSPLRRCPTAEAFVDCDVANLANFFLHVGTLFDKRKVAVEIFGERIFVAQDKRHHRDIRCCPACRLGEFDLTTLGKGDKTVLETV
mmetsp:Transcript_88677/g.132884  ORF Transcript_88677/g.132884 Transcript_88677/m.132884 type:complete len:219 (-) Transcript_88677:496-1152(-)